MKNIVSKIQLKRLSDAKLIIKKHLVGNVIPVLFLDAATYEYMKLQLDEKPGNDGTLKLKLPNGETKFIDSNTIIIIDDIE